MFFSEAPVVLISPPHALIRRGRVAQTNAPVFGTEFFVDIGEGTRARIVETPFYKRKKEVPA